MKIINHPNSSRARLKNKRVGLWDRSDEDGFIIQFAKLSTEAETDKTFCTSHVSRGVRYTTISLTREATLAFIAVAMERFKTKRIKRS